MNSGGSKFLINVMLNPDGKWQRLSARVPKEFNFGALKFNQGAQNVIGWEKNIAKRIYNFEFRNKFPNFSTYYYIDILFDLEILCPQIMSGLMLIFW